MEITFSKNGKPMGRTKSTMVRKNKQWTAEEDNYIRIAIQEGRSTAEVSARLGRSIASISGRKWALGIEGRLASSKGKKGTKMNRHSIAGTMPTTNLSFGSGIMELESGIPLPTKSSRNEEARNKMRSLFQIQCNRTRQEILSHLQSYVIGFHFDTKAQLRLGLFLWGDFTKNRIR